MTRRQIVEVPIRGMDCAECTRHVQHAIAALPGIESVDVFLSSEKAVIGLDPAVVELTDIHNAVNGAGYSVPTPGEAESAPPALGDFSPRVITLFGIVFGAVLFVAVAGEWLGLFKAITNRVPWPIGLAIVLVGGYPVFRNVVRATLKGQVISHTLMALGVVAALAVGQWASAVVVAFFMRAGEYAERFTTECAHRAVKDLTSMAPHMARVEREDAEIEAPVTDVRLSETVIVRPGESIPVDGEVISGHATVDQATITGESMPVEAGPGARVFAATLAPLGSLRIRATHVGPDTTFGRVVKMVEDAEAHRAEVRQIVDRFSAYYLPVVAGIGALTLLLRGDPLAAASVLVVACSCSFALATPTAMLASIGAGIKRGLLIKGGKYLEPLARTDVLLINKTGTLTLGHPRITGIPPQQGASDDEILTPAASAERYPEHPMAEAVRATARERESGLLEPEQFEAIPGLGVRARVNDHLIVVGSRQMISKANSIPGIDTLEAQGKTVLLVARDGELIGIFAATDTLRPKVPTALAAMQDLGVT